MQALTNDNRQSVLKLVPLILLGFTVLSCGLVGTHYFQNQIDQATQEQVAQRYGSPHEVAPQRDGGEVWTYYDRGSATAGYSGYATSTYCRAYILSFDQQGVLRAWNEGRCRQ